VSAAGELVKSVAATLHRQPTLLVVLILNAMMIAGASAVLLRVEDHRAAERRMVLERCLAPLPARQYGD
jgi:hypothetical protein